LKFLSVINIETTGHDIFEDDIIEIGIVRIDRGWNICGRFSSLVWPGEAVFSRPETASALALQKREKSDLMFAPSPDEVAKAALAFIGDWKHTQIASFNIHFERGFLRRKAWERIGKGYPWPVCIMELCSNIMGSAGSPYCPWNEYHRSYKWPRLNEAAHFFGVRYDHIHVHSALHNAEVAARIYIKILSDTSNGSENEGRLEA
jgi:DNA polymerase III epsilon subunit-like protein